MMFNKKQLVLLIGLSVMLSACWKPEGGGPTSDGAASFNVTSFDGKDEVPNEIRSKWRIPTHKIMNFTACIEERSTTAKARGQKFEIVDPQTGSVVASDLKTINTGCMVWQENLPYNYFAKQAYYIEMTRIIRATGSQIGERTVVFYVNPWASDRGEKTKTVVFARDSKIDMKKVAANNVAMKALSGELESKPRIWLGDISVKTTKDRIGEDKTAGGAISLEVAFSPSVELFDSAGNVYWKDINQGQFKIYTHLLVNDMGKNRAEKLILTQDASPQTESVVKGKVRIDRKAMLSARATEGRLELGLRVEAVDGPSTIDAFEGVYRLDQAGKLTGSFSATVKNDVVKNRNSFDLASYLATASNFEDLKKSRHAMDMTPYTFTIARPRYLKVAPGETATTRGVEFSVSTKVVDNVLGDTVGEGTKFIVELPDGRRQPVYADNEGYIRWNSTVVHKYYKPENYDVQNVKIYDETGKHLVGKKVFSINPWDDKFTFGFDRAEMDDKFFDDIDKRALIPSKFYIDQFSYHTLRFRYQIDKFMGLQVKKTILLELHPQVLRYSGIVGGRKVTEDLRDGIYALKVAIQKDYLDPAERNVFISNKRGENIDDGVKNGQGKKIDQKYYVDVAKKLVQVFDGHIITPVELSMSDLRLMRVRSQFLIQLETIDETKVQLVNYINEKEYKDLIKLRHELRNSADSAEEDDEKKIALREKYVQDKIKRKKRLTAILKTLDNKTMDNEAFMKEAGLNEVDIAALNEKLKQNDFSQFDLSPMVDPDYEQDTDSGLKSRTFVGPMIFLSNAYSDSVRPTDSLTEVYCDTNDCNFIEEERREQGYSKPSESYEHNKFFGSIAHLENATVDSLIAKRLQLDKEYYEKMPQIASPGNYADSFDLNLLSLGNEQFKSLVDGCDIDHGNCEGPSKRQYTPNNLPIVLNDTTGNDGRTLSIRQLNSSASPISLVLDYRKAWGHSFGMDDFIAIWKSPVLPKAYAEWICFMVSGRSQPNENYSFRLSKIYKECLYEFNRDPESFIAIDRKLRVKETGNYDFRGGKQMNLNVGSSFSVGHSSSESVSTGIEAMDFFPATLLKSIPMIGGALAYAAKPLSVKVGSSESFSKSDGTSVSEQTYLVMQMANFGVELNSYERCMILRPSDHWLQRTEYELALAKHRGTNEPGMSEDLKSKGIMICSGETVRNKAKVMESYFYFTQHFTEGDMLDQYDLYNHPWLLALRGVRDFTNFAKLLRKQSDKDASWYSALNPLTYISYLTDPTSRPTQKVVDKTGWPLDKMAETYRNVMPSFPGFYTIVRKDEFIKDYPWEIEQRDENLTVPLARNEKGKVLRDANGRPLQKIGYDEDIRKPGPGMLERVIEAIKQ